MTTFMPVASGPRDAETLVDDKDLTPDEKLTLGKLKKQLTVARKNNEDKYSYYRTRQVVEQLDIAIPPQLRDVPVICGWPETVVDVLEERIDMLGWAAANGDLRGLDEVAEDNDISIESSRATADSLIAGVGFVSVGEGDEDEPDVIITGESPNHSTVIWDYRKRRAIAGISQTFNARNQCIMQSLYMPNRTLLFETDPIKGGKLEVTAVDNHKMNRVMMAQLLTRDSASDVGGRSEITRAVRYYTDAAVRTLLGMEVNREFYTTPMRALLDVDPETLGFTDDMTEAEKKRRGWSLIMGHLNIVPPQGNPNSPAPSPRPTITELRPAPPTPYIEQIKAYSIMLSGQTGMPAEMFGFVTDNPTSGDAILKGEYRLVRRAERRIQSYNRGWKEVALLALLRKHGPDAVSTDDLRNIRPLWRNPAIPTRAAQADEAQKLIAAKVLPPNSSVTYRRLDISDHDQLILEQDWRKQEAKEQAQMAREAANQLNTQVAITKAKAAATPAPTGGQPGRPNVGGGPSS